MTTKFEVGKTYQLRGGGSVTVTEIDCPDHPAYPIRAEGIARNGCPISSLWTYDGLYARGETDDLDMLLPDPDAIPNSPFKLNHIYNTRSEVGSVRIIAYVPEDIPEYPLVGVALSDSPFWEKGVLSTWSLDGRYDLDKRHKHIQDLVPPDDPLPAILDPLAAAIKALAALPILRTNAQAEALNLLIHAKRMLS
ncbi:MAG: hypothetical protein WCZ23_10725 [Rhodospirillaceae bacterium]